MTVKIGIVTPFEFEGYLIFGMDVRYKDVFENELSFQVSIDKKGRLCIVSERCLR